MNADPKGPDPAPDNPGMLLHAGTLQAFAQNMVENIIQSFMSQMEPEVDHRASSSNQDWETLAEGLASAVIEVALKEACRGRTEEDFQNSQEVFQSSSSPLSPHRQDGTGQAGKPPVSDGSVDMDSDKEPSLSNTNTQAYHPLLSQSGLPIVGSLDYPDAPPTTPLVPEPARSKDSFIRKLKGGLAKEFLPSPPPPTPKDEQGDSEAPGGDPGLDFMEDVMRSLSTGEAGWKDDLTAASDSYEGGNHVVGPREVKLKVFADALSADIINRVTSHYAAMFSAKNTEQTADDSDVHLLARQLAETIITSSLAEVKMFL